MAESRSWLESLKRRQKTIKDQEINMGSPDIKGFERDSEQEDEAI